MANIGFHQAMQAAGIAVRTTAVGDRYVLEEMLAGGYSLGGEQSGHIILTDHATTGDGLLSALAPDGRGGGGRPAARRAGVHRARSSRRCCSTCGSATRPPSRCRPRSSRPSAQAEAELAASGRVLLRPSGTEPLVRVMVEAPSHEQARAVAERVAKVVGTV